MTSDSLPIASIPQSGQPARILIVDDHPMMREGLSALLSNQPDLVACGEAANISEALQLANNTAPDVVVVDIALNGENGLELVRQLKSHNPLLRILVLSMYDDELYAERALEAGAMGYLNKQSVGHNIIVAIRRVLAGERYLRAETEAYLSDRHIRSTHSRTGYGVSSLTNRELDVFKLIGAGATTHEVAQKLHVSVKTVESHRQKIKLKLGLQTSAQLGHEATRFFLENG
jgi:DNA-binding NarL/FixJ family response regulator